MANDPMIVQFCPNPAKHALILLLYGLCNANLQYFNAVWHRRHTDGILHEAHNKKSRRLSD
jgi:hypothetical protein